MKRTLPIVCSYVVTVSAAVGGSLDYTRTVEIETTSLFDELNALFGRYKLKKVVSRWVPDDPNQTGWAVTSMRLSDEQTVAPNTASGLDFYDLINSGGRFNASNKAQHFVIPINSNVWKDLDDVADADESSADAIQLLAVSGDTFSASQNMWNVELQWHILAEYRDYS
jgi:hypothetical protein